jgi:hypothetical protein
MAIFDLPGMLSRIAAAIRTNGVGGITAPTVEQLFSDLANSIWAYAAQNGADGAAASAAEAQEQADIATGAASTSVASSGTSTASATTATTQAGIATTAATTATTQAGVATGAAGTATGAAGTATTQSTAAATSATTAATNATLAQQVVANANGALSLPATVISGPWGSWPEAIVDASNNLLRYIDANGDHNFNGVKGSSGTFGTLNLSTLGAVPVSFPTLSYGGVDYAQISVDANNRPFAGVDTAGGTWGIVNGTFQAIIGGSAIPTYAYSAGNGNTLPADTTVYELIFGYGYSLDYGNNGASDVTVTTAALDTGNSLMFNSGVRPYGAAVTSLVDLVEGTNAGASKESGGAQMLHALQTRFLAATGSKRKMIYFVAGLGGADIPSVKRGSVTYAEALRLVKAAVTLAGAAGGKVVVRGFTTQLGAGEYNHRNTALRVKHLYARLRADFSTDIRAITGQSEPVRMMIVQVNRGFTAPVADPTWSNGALQAGEMDPLICVAGPQYQLQGDSGVAIDGQPAGAHFSVVGYADQGVYLGTRPVAEEWYGNGFEALRAVAWWMSSSTTITVTYNKPVLVDTSSAVVDDTALAFHGFNFDDGSGSPPTLTGVAYPATTVQLNVTSNTVTFTSSGGAGATASWRTAGVLTVATLQITVAGVKYWQTVRADDVVGDTVTAFAALIAGTTVSTNVLSFTSTPASLSAAIYQDTLILTLSTAPTGLRKRLYYANQLTGSGQAGNQTGARGTVRGPALVGTGPTSDPLYEWACVQVLDLSLPSG